MTIAIIKEAISPRDNVDRSNNCAINKKDTSLMFLPPDNNLIAKYPDASAVNNASSPVNQKIPAIRENIPPEEDIKIPLCAPAEKIASYKLGDKSCNKTKGILTNRII
mgnify:CR=1 FL=1